MTDVFIAYYKVMEKKRHANRAVVLPWPGISRGSYFVSARRGKCRSAASRWYTC